MFDLLKKRRISKYTKAAEEYLAGNYCKPAASPKFSMEPTFGKGLDRSSEKNNGDRYDALKVARLMSAYTSDSGAAAVSRSMDSALDRTFVDEVIRYIDLRDLKDSQVYKAAGLDRRLFSKMMSDRNYKPSKDTAISVAYALYLSLNQAKDLLERAGYSLSHSNKRDVVLEYFFAERIYRISDINEVLYNLGEKTLGR